MRARDTATENVRSLMFHRLGKKSKQPQRGVSTTYPLPPPPHTHTHTHPALYMYVRGLGSGLVFVVNTTPTVKAHSKHVFQI